MLEVAFVSIVLLSLVSTIGYATANKRLHRQLATYSKENQKLLTTSNDLLRANEDMAANYITDDVVESTIINNPKLIKTHMIENIIEQFPEKIPESSIKSVLSKNTKFFSKIVDQVLEEDGIIHIWERTGSNRWRMNGNVLDDLISEKCKRCGLLHRYWKAGGLPKFLDHEGYFRGGKRVDGSVAQVCVSKKKG